jgi:dynein heavy chain
VLQFKGIKYTIVSEEMMLVECYRKLLAINLNELEKKKKPFSKEILTNLITFSVIWSIGAVLHEDCRAALSAHLLKQNPELKLPVSNIFDCAYSIDRNVWLEWMAVDTKFRLPISNKIAFHELIIPTKDTVRNSYLLKLYINNNQHTLIFGPTGTSKSCTI